MIIEQFEVSRMMVFAYLIGCENTGKALVIDPAAEAGRITDRADRLGLRIEFIVNTHCHVDHVMGNADMVERTGARIIIHEDDAKGLLIQPPEMFEMFGGRPSPPADITVQEGDIVFAGDVQLEVIHTPGHSLGGICLYCDGAVFTGDTLFVGGVGRTDLPGGSWPTLMHSIKEKLFTMPAETIVFPGHNYGHSPTSTIGDERASGLY